MRTEEIKAMTHIRTQDGASASPMKGKTVLFTGGSCGMGRYASLELARCGVEILVVGHNDARDWWFGGIPACGHGRRRARLRTRRGGCTGYSAYLF